MASVATPPTSLRAGLQAQADAQFQIVKSASMKSLTANGQHVQFNGDDESQFSAQNILSVWVYLIELFDRAVADFQQTSFQGSAIYPGRWNGPPTPEPTDAEVEVKMETYLRPVYGYSSNFMYLAK